MTQSEFEQTVNSFDGTESMRSEVYYRALSLVSANFVVEAHLLLLSTWNFARFRYVIPSFDLCGYEALLNDLTNQLQPLLHAEFTTVDLGKDKQMIVDSFDKLAGIRGIESTGAAKILHLLNPHLFVMWDNAIGGRHSPKKDYANLDVIRSGFWNPPVYPFARSGAGYYDFLGYCQTIFKGLVSPSPRKTLAKCIDEFNYCSITKRLQRLR